MEYVNLGKSGLKASLYLVGQSKSGRADLI